MATPRLAPLKFWGKCTFLVFFLVLSLPNMARTEPTHTVPLLFDARDRLPGADLSALTRLRFVTTVDFPPFNFMDQTGRLAGFQVDLARLICAELKVADKCQIQAMPFGEIEAALDSGQVDAAIAGHAATAALRARFGFSRPFLALPARFAVNRKAMPAGETAAALAGRKVGVLAATTHEEMLKAYFPGIVPVTCETRAALLEALKAGSVEAVFTDGVQLIFWTASPAADLCCSLFDGPYFSETYLGEGLSVMLRKQDKDLTAAIDHALLMLSRNGRLQEIYLRYFPNGLY